MQDFSDNFILYSGKKYLFNASIFSDSLSQEELSHGLRNSNILLFEYSNEFNLLYLEGSLVYQDNFGVLDKYLEKSLVYVLIMFVQMIQKFDKQTTIEKLSDTHKFIHTFIVNGIKILKREHHVITYKLSLVGLNWLNSSKTINFSNYNEEPLPIFDIIKSMLNINKLNVNTESFSMMDCPVKINYITNGNDNSITSIKYLLGKLYYYSLKDSGLKFITYNEHDDLYYAVNIADHNTFLGNSSVLISFFKSTMESIIYEDYAELNTVTKFPKTNVFLNFKAKTFFDFNYNENKFIDASISSSSIIDFLNSYFESDIYENKYDFYTNDEKLNERGGYWNNNFNIYANAAKTLTEDSAIVVNAVGEMLRKPGYLVNLNVDRDIKYLEDESLESKEILRNKYRTFEGVWVVSKVRTIIIPGTILADKHMFRQNLVLSRNFVKKYNS